MAESATDIIERWGKVFRAANGKEPPFAIYERGWYRIGRPSTSYRRADVERMIATLEFRAKQNVAPTQKGEGR